MKEKFKNVQSMYLYPRKLSIKYEDEFNTFSNQWKFENFVASWSTLQEILKQAP